MGAAKRLWRLDPSWRADCIGAIAETVSFQDTMAIFSGCDSGQRDECIEVQLVDFAVATTFDLDGAEDSASAFLRRRGLQCARLEDFVGLAMVRGGDGALLVAEMVERLLRFDFIEHDI